MSKKIVWIAAVTLTSLVWCGCDSMELVYQQRQAYLEAVQRNDVCEVRHHLANGVDVNTIDVRGRTATKIASCQGHDELVTLLQANGGKLKIRRPGGG